MSSQDNRCAGSSIKHKTYNFVINKDLSTEIKGIAIMFVILGHMNYIDCAGAWGVHLFLLISGYGIAISLEKKGQKEYWLRRIKSVYLPYLLVTLIFLVVRLLINEKLSSLDVAISLIGLDFGRNLDQTMWYISYIFAWYGIAWLLYTLRNKKYFCICVSAFALLLMAALGYTSVIWRKGTIAWAYFLSFPLGMFLAKYRNIKFTLFEKNALLTVIVIICSAIVILDYGKPHSGINELVFTFSAALGVLSLAILVETNVKFSGGG